MEARIKAISDRFVQRIKAGTAVFMPENPTVPGIPCSISDGEARSINGMNRMILMQVMADRQLKDTRFFTASQIKEAGWTLQPDAKQFALSYFVTVDQKGIALGEAEERRFHVFNAEQISGVPAGEPDAIKITGADISRAAMTAGLVNFDNLPQDVVQWASWKADKDLPLDELMLRACIAQASLSAVLPMTGAIGDVNHFKNTWIEKIEKDPKMLFRAVRDADLIVASILKAINEVAIERVAQEEIVVNKGERAGNAYAHKLDAMFEERQAVLAVRIEDRLRVKELGATWYPKQAIWFVPKGADENLFNEWNPRKHSLSAEASSNILMSDFQDAMNSCGLDTSKELIPDGKWHSVAVNSKTRRNLAGSYVFSLDGARDGGAIGTIINHHSGEKMTWKYKGELLTPEQRVKMRAESLAREAAGAHEIETQQNVAAIHAGEIWSQGTQAIAQGYISKKGISPDGLRQISGSVLRKYSEFIGESGLSAIKANETYLLVPMRTAEGELRAVQAINHDGAIKSFMRGAQKRGTMFVLGAEDFQAIASTGATSMAFAEGVATGASLHEATGLPTVVCFDAGNLETVVKETAVLALGVQRVIGCDNDQFFIERAAGYLSSKVCVNPCGNEATLRVQCGQDSSREVCVGQIRMDGEVHEATGGTYSVELHAGKQLGQIKLAVIEITPADGSRKVRSIFENRGIEAGNRALESLGSDPAKAVMVVPEFRSLTGRPTDWNDMARMEGLSAIRQQIEAAGVQLPQLAREQAPIVARVKCAGISR